MSAELARRAVACKGWRWMPGMRDVDGSTIVGVSPLGVIRYARPVLGAEVTDGTRPGFAWNLDLSDPATLGCLLALVREAWGDPAMSCHLTPNPIAWGVYLGGRPQSSVALVGRSEAEALVEALEAAP